MENYNDEPYGIDYDNYYQNGGWYQDEYGEWQQDPNFTGHLNGSDPYNESKSWNHDVHSHHDEGWYQDETTDEWYNTLDHIQSEEGHYEYQ